MEDMGRCTDDPVVTTLRLDFPRDAVAVVAFVSCLFTNPPNPSATDSKPEERTTTHQYSTVVSTMCSPPSVCVAWFTNSQRACQRGYISRHLVSALTVRGLPAPQIQGQDTLSRSSFHDKALRCQCHGFSRET